MKTKQKIISAWFKNKLNIAKTRIQIVKNKTKTLIIYYQSGFVKWVLECCCFWIFNSWTNQTTISLYHEQIAAVKTIEMTTIWPSWINIFKSASNMLFWVNIMYQFDIKFDFSSICLIYLQAIACNDKNNAVYIVNFEITRCNYTKYSIWQRCRILNYVFTRTQ